MPICDAWDHDAQGTALLAQREGGADEYHWQGQRREADTASVL